MSSLVFRRVPGLRAYTRLVSSTSAHPTREKEHAPEQPARSLQGPLAVRSQSWRARSQRLAQWPWARSSRPSRRRWAARCPPQPSGVPSPIRRRRKKRKSRQSHFTIETKGEMRTGAASVDASASAGAGAASVSVGAGASSALPPSDAAGVCRRGWESGYQRLKFQEPYDPRRLTASTF